MRFTWRAEFYSAVFDRATRCATNVRPWSPTFYGILNRRNPSAARSCRTTVLMLGGRLRDSPTGRDQINRRGVKDVKQVMPIGLVIGFGGLYFSEWRDVDLRFRIC
jgi:hypothetical protein